MKKLFFLATLFVALASTAVAQNGPGGDPAAMKERMKERVKPGLMEKTKITSEQADKVIDINIESQASRRALRTDDAMSDEDRKKKMTAIDEEVTKKYKAIPLTDDQVKAVNEYFEDMRKNRPGPRPSGQR